MKHLIGLIVIFLLFSCSEKKPENGEISVPKGFEVKQMFSPSENGMGSWVSLAVDGKGRLIASDQYGELYRIDISKDDVLDSTKIERMDISLGFAQGMVWAYNSLYVMVNKYPDTDHSFSSGLYRVSDSDSDDRLDKIEKLFDLDGEGEHGPHGIVKGPDGYLYLLAGNHTLIPEMAKYAMADVWGEDSVLPVIKDPNGHATEIKAPGGWLARTDSLGGSLEVISVGFRNSYDLSFNAEGDIFVFDSDMEWDMGSPWYRPIRICNAFPGADFGWRTGSGKMPEYYADNLPGIANLDQGSPTGVLYSRGLNFPKEFEGGLFAMDWSFGTIYFVDLEKDKNSYKTEVREFLKGNSLPLTDMVSLNGDMYFTTGGRRLTSGFYRVRYTGDGKELNRTETDISIKIEKKYSSLDSIWEDLGNTDRIVRYKARIALEMLDSLTWIERIPFEDRVDVRVQAIIAATRLTPALDRNQLGNWLSEIEYNSVSPRQQLDLIRAYQLIIIRYGTTESLNRLIIGELEDHFPSKHPDINRELSKLLSVVNSKTIVAKTIEQMQFSEEQGSPEAWLEDDAVNRSSQYGDIIALIKRNTPETRLLGYLEVLSVVDSGWNDTNRDIYFSSFQKIYTSTGGSSYKGFARKIMNRALTHMDSEEREKFRAQSGSDLALAGDTQLAELPKPEGPGQIWEKDKLVALSAELSKGDQVNGKRMFAAALCFSCHSVGEEGRSIGPDLSTLSSRFGLDDIITAIAEPNASVTDQYSLSDIILRDSSNFRGRVLEIVNDTLLLSVNPFNPSQIRRIPNNEIMQRDISKNSPMPAGLLNRLNEKEVIDLLAYLQGLRKRDL